MTISIPPLPERYLKTVEAARLLGLSARTLEKHRTYGTGPTFHKLGGRVVYALDALQSWASKGKRISTTDAGIGRIVPTTESYPALRRPSA